MRRPVSGTPKDTELRNLPLKGFAQVFGRAFSEGLRAVRLILGTIND
jgi:hypothetical protein